MTNELAELTRDGNLWSIRYVLSLRANLAEVWGALTESGSIAQWMSTEAMDFDPRVGGSVHYFWGGTLESKGTVSVFNPPYDLEYSWNQGVSTSMVRFELGEAEGRTELILHHDKITTDDVRAIAPGWHTHLEMLQALLANGEVEFQPRFDELAPLYDEVIDRT